MVKWFNQMLPQDKGFSVIQSILLLEEMRIFIVEEEALPKYQTDLPPVRLVACTERLRDLTGTLVEAHYNASGVTKKAFEEEISRISAESDDIKRYLLSKH